MTDTDRRARSVEVDRVGGEGHATRDLRARSVEVDRVGGDGHATRATDRVAVEAPLQVVVNGEPFAVIMRTPGDDDDLVAGFLLAEGVIGGAGGVVLEPGSTPGGRDVVAVRLTGADLPASAVAPGALRRAEVNAACGLCGRVRVESIDVDRPPLVPSWTVPREVVAALPDRLRAVQRVFDETGGLHAAGLFDLAGELESSAEDVGRHNAVDKVIGRALRAGRLPLARSLLAVSGRLAFEIVQKALLAGVPLVAAVSAPSSLAVDLAEAAGITLVGFARAGAFNVYAHPRRIGGSGRISPAAYRGRA